MEPLDAHPSDADDVRLGASLVVDRLDVFVHESDGVTLGREGREEREGSTSFERQVAQSLTLCTRVGNIYTGSLYLGLAGMLHAGAVALAGRRIGLFSYGSGCASEFFSGVVGKNAVERIRRATLDEVIGARERVTVEEYERMMALAPERPPEIPPAPGGFRFTGMHEHRRQYSAG